MKGEVINIGTMEVDGTTMTGVFIQVSKKDLKEENFNLLYRRVKVEVDKGDDNVKKGGLR